MSNTADILRLAINRRRLPNHCIRLWMTTRTEENYCGVAIISDTLYWTSTRERILANGNAANPVTPVRFPASTGSDYRMVVYRRSRTTPTRTLVTGRPSRMKAFNFNRRQCLLWPGTTPPPQNRRPIKLLLFNKLLFTTKSCIYNENVMSIVEGIICQDRPEFSKGGGV